VFSKELEKQPVVLLFQSVVLHLVVFEKDLKSLTLIDLLSNQFNKLFREINRLIFENP